MLLPLIVLLVTPAAEPNEAEKLFREMESKVNKAKNIECHYEYKLEAGSVTRTENGTLLVAEANKLRMDVTNESGGRTFKIMQIADGMKMAFVLGSQKEFTDAPTWLTDGMRSALTRSGLFLGTSITLNEKKLKVDEHFKVSDFKLGKKEKVGDKEAQVVEYTFKDKGSSSYAVSVWIDTKTNLPLKRVIQTDNKIISATETYTKLDLDPKIDPKQFELPK